MQATVRSRVMVITMAADRERIFRWIGAIMVLIPCVGVGVLMVAGKVPVHVNLLGSPWDRILIGIGLCLVGINIAMKLTSRK